eukprot:GGOE01020184.1.p1 GENE.GGOE01020184.1~~GGOE01020184.1.p1  ORF type:complete len:425 (+),score=96.56 GGOE01020184.1:54-1328(+)
MSVTASFLRRIEASNTVSLQDLGSSLPFLKECKEVLVAAFVAPTLFEEVLTRLAPSEAVAIQCFSVEMAQVMTEDQKRHWRTVILGLEKTESESHTVRAGGLIDGDIQLLTNFLQHDRNIAAIINRQLGNTQLREALLHCTAEWKGSYAVDESLPKARKSPEGSSSSSSTSGSSASLRKGKAQDSPGDSASKASTSQLGPRVSVSGGFPYANHMQPEDRVMWLQGLSWSLKFQKSCYEALLRWREGLLRELDSFSAQFRDKKSLLGSRKTIGSYLLVASNLRTRVCLCSPQCGPAAAKVLYGDYVTSAAESCSRIFQVSRKRVGMLSKLTSSKCGLRDLLLQQAEALRAVAVEDVVKEQHPSLTAQPKTPALKFLSPRVEMSSAPLPAPVPSPGGISTYQLLEPSTSLGAVSESEEDLEDDGPY